MRVVGGARRVERVEADVALHLDVTDEESSAAFVTQAVEELGGVDILFNNAGLALGRYPFTESNLEDEKTVRCTRTWTACCGSRGSASHIATAATSSS